MSRKVEATHGIVCRLPGRHDGYFGWPSVAKMEDGTIIAASSGLRTYHVDPWGKTVINISRDGGKNFSEPIVINNSLIDDRDAGIIDLGGGKILVSWFALDTRRYYDILPDRISDEDWRAAKAEMDAWPDGEPQRLMGSWVMLSEDNGVSWGDPIRVPVSAPHGPVKLESGRIVYLGKEFVGDAPEGDVALAESVDGGRSWEIIGKMPLPDGRPLELFHEPHIIECTDGSLLGVIRYHISVEEEESGGLSMYQTRSRDGGRTWSTPTRMAFEGAPPHLLRHSSGAIVLVYGYRHPGYGQRAAISRDEGETWSEELILRDDGPDGDLGYPCSIELGDGSIYTVYYQKYEGDEKCSLLYTKWRID